MLQPLPARWAEARLDRRYWARPVRGPGLWPGPRAWNANCARRLAVAPIDRSGRYDWSSFLPMLRAALAQECRWFGTSAIMAIPTGLDIFAPEFVDRFARFVAAAARIVRDETDQMPFYCPVNEISYWAWVGGDEARFYPAVRGRGGELKRQLVRASIAAIEAVRDVDPRVRILHAEPRSDHRRSGDAQGGRHGTAGARGAVRGVGHADRKDRARAGWQARLSRYRRAQFLFGQPVAREWRHDSAGPSQIRALAGYLAYIHARYGRPLYLAETGAERSARAAWLHYVGGEVRAALDRGLPIEGICLYPILDYPGWERRSAV